MNRLTQLSIRINFPWNLDFFASFFDQAKNEDQFYSEIEKLS
jgi:hypothetical protein